jgi:predicted tellurium resistance membrane protein TerC
MLEIVFSLFTLTILEIVLGVDNLVFISVISARLPPEQQRRARQFGLCLAWVSRLILLASAIWLARLTAPLFSVADFAVSIRDIFLFCGGLFLLVKATQEIHHEMVSITEPERIAKPKRFWPIIFQIGILDIIFSLDSVITAIGLTQQFWIMAVSITIAIAIMIGASEMMSRFINKHPTIKILAFSFLILIGTMLIADGLNNIHRKRKQKS